METDRQILDQGCQFGTDDRSPEPRNRGAPPPSSLGRRRPGKDPTGLSHATDLSKGSFMTGWVSPDPGWGRAGLGRCAAGVCGERAGISTRVSWRPPFCSRIHFSRLKAAIERQWQIRSKRGVPSWVVAESSPARTCLSIANRVFGPKALHSPSSQATVPDAQREEFFRLRYRVCRGTVVARTRGYLIPAR